MASMVLNVYRMILQCTILAVIVVSTVLGSMGALHGSEGNGTVAHVLQFLVYVHIYFTLGLWFAAFILKVVKVQKMRDIIGQNVCDNVCYMADLISDLPRPLFWFVLLTSFFCSKLSNIFMPMVMLQTSAFFAQASFVAAFRGNRTIHREEVH